MALDPGPPPLLHADEQSDSYRLSEAMRGRVRKAVILMTLGMWASSFLASTVAGAVSGEEDLLARALVRLGVVAVGIGICAALLKLLESTPSRPFRRRVLMTLSLTAAAAVVTLMVNMLALHWSGRGMAVTRMMLAENIYYLAVWFWFFLSWAALYLAIVYGAQVREETAARAADKVYATRARLQALRYQINPHFLFNTLNSLSSLVMDGRSREAEAMISRLSAFLRTTLADEEDGDVELSTELKHQQLYLAIEQARFPELRVEVEFASGLEPARVPNLILQPLVENAVRHGPGGRRSRRIQIRAEAADGRLQLAILSDTDTEGRRIGMGLGLANVRERLQLRYQGRHQMTAGPRPDGTFEVRLSLPLVFA